MSRQHLLTSTLLALVLFVPIFAQNAPPAEEEAREAPKRSEEEIQKELADLYRQQLELNQRRVELLKELSRGEVGEYEFKDAEGKASTLDSMFGDKSDLIVIHNMGSSCPYCTLWLDGQVGLLKHYESRAAVVVMTPDAPADAEAFAAARGWKFHMVSEQGTTFRADMGFESEHGTMPGFSTFHRGEDGKITHIASDFYGPGDAYCGIWHKFSLLLGGVGRWQPSLETRDE